MRTPLFARDELLFDGAAIDSPAFVDARSALRESEQRRIAGRAGRALFRRVGVVDAQAVLATGAGDHRFAFWAGPLRRLIHAAKVALSTRPSTLQADQDFATRAK